MTRSHTYPIYLLVALFLSACGGTFTVTRTNADAPIIIRKVSLSGQEGNSPEVTEHVLSALTARGVDVGPSLPMGTSRSSDVDAIVTYLDVWRWDLATYMQSITINLYNAKSGELLVVGKWKDSFWHGFNRGESIARELLEKMFSKLRSE